MLELDSLFSRPEVSIPGFEDRRPVGFPLGTKKGRWLTVRKKAYGKGYGKDEEIDGGSHPHFGEKIHRADLAVPVKGAGRAVEKTSQKPAPDSISAVLEIAGGGGHVTSDTISGFPEKSGVAGDVQLSVFVEPGDFIFSVKIVAEREPGIVPLEAHRPEDPDHPGMFRTPRGKRFRKTDSGPVQNSLVGNRDRRALAGGEQKGCQPCKHEQAHPPGTRVPRAMGWSRGKDLVGNRFDGRRSSEVRLNFSGGVSEPLPWLR